MIPTRRNFLIGASASLITAPAIVRAASLMPVKAIEAYGRAPMLDALNFLAAQVAREWDDRLIQYAFGDMVRYGTGHLPLHCHVRLRARRAPRMIGA